MFKTVVTKSKIALITGLCIAPSLLAQDIDYGIAVPQLNAQTFILMDYNSGAVIAALNPDQRQYPASLTKMMTSYVVGDALKRVSGFSG